MATNVGSDAGDRALREGEWNAAREAFEDALDRAETSAAHDGLGRALWWLGDADAAIAHRERAFALSRERGDAAAAARIAVWLSREYRAVFGNEAAANGWLARAERLVADDTASVARGWVELARGRREADAVGRPGRAESALAIAAASHDPDLEVAALAELGLAAIERGDVRTGLDRLDEAMAAATSGESDLPETIAEACCTLVGACELAGDAGRLSQWARIVEPLLARGADLPSLAFCRTCNAEMLAATGRREDAERELLASTRALAAAGHRSRCVDPAVKLAEVRILQGRFEEASSLLDGRDGLPETAIPRADLSLATGEPSLAIAALLRRLNRIHDDGLLSAPLLARLAEAQLAQGDREGAAATAERLAALAEDSGHPMIAAYDDLTRARLASSPDDAGAAIDRAADRFGKLGMPLDEALARLVLAESLAPSDPDAAAAEARRASDAFDRLGATRYTDRAAKLIRDVGGPARTGPKVVGTLTKREQEVLGLLGEGLSNAEIASRLYISPKTAGHHVSSVLAKLHLRSRQEAAAFAVRSLNDRAPI